MILETFDSVGVIFLRPLVVLSVRRLGRSHFAVARQSLGCGLDKFDRPFTLGPA